MSLTDIFGESFGTLWGYPKSIVPYLILELAITALGILLIVTALPGMILANMRSATFTDTLLSVIVISFLIGLFITPLFYGMYTNLEVQKLTRKKLSLGSAYKAAKSRYATLFWAGLINLAIYAAIALVFVAVLAVILASSPVVKALGSAGTVPVATASSIRPAILLIGVILLWLILLAICLGIVAILMFQYVPALIIEKKGAVDSIKRSIGIGKRNFWNILGIFVIYAILLFAIYFVAGLISSPFSLISRSAGIVVQLFVSAVAGSFLYPWYIVLMASFYNSHVKKIR